MILNDTYDKMTTICHVWGKALPKTFYLKLFSVLLHAQRVSYAGKNLLFIVSVCVAACKDPILLSTWPLGFGTGVNDSQAGVAVGTIGADVTFEQGPPGVGNSSLQFNGGLDSYVDLRVNNRSELWIPYQNQPDFSLSMYLYVDDASSGTLFHYVSDAYSNHTANDESDIKQIKVFIENGEIFVDYGANRTTPITGAVASEKTWHYFVFSRDCSKDATTIYLYQNIAAKYDGSIKIATLPGRHTQFPGLIRIGNSFNTIASASGSLIGRVMCLKMFAMRDPTWLCYDTDKDCSTSTIVPTTSSTSTTTTTTSSSSSTMLPTTTTTSMPPTPITTAPEKDACARFVVSQFNVTLMASPDIFDVMNVSDISTCVAACVRSRPCRGFVATSWGTNGKIECKLSYNITLLVYSVGHNLWELL